MIRLPYGREFIAFDETGTKVLRSRVNELTGGGAGEQIVREAMARPYGGTSLRELAKGKKTCTLIISDHTRPVPSRDILPAMLEELRGGNPEIEITLLVATGCHRGTTRAELREKLGEAAASSERIVVHDAFDESSNVCVGSLPSGAPLVIDRLAAETDLLAAEGFIEPHFFAGFSGGRKSVLPGVCDRVTVLGNHCSRFIDSPFARTGILEQNPIHRDMTAAAVTAKLRYIVNAVIDENKRTVAAFAGEPAAAHAAGCAFLRPFCEVRGEAADIVITTNGGAPLDQNIYQCVKGLTAAEAASKENAILILCAECADGVGGDGIYRLLKECAGPGELYESIMARPQGKTTPDQWQGQILARILKKHRVIFVTRPELETVVRDMKMDFAPSLPAALGRARRNKGGSASVTVIPNGVSVIVGLHQSGGRGDTQTP
jgi:nickel-dependent lactate racemase